jgi:hypothetical protein
MRTSVEPHLCASLSSAITRNNKRDEAWRKHTKRASAPAVPIVAGAPRCSFVGCRRAPTSNPTSHPWCKRHLGESSCAPAGGIPCGVAGCGNILNASAARKYLTFGHEAICRECRAARGAA